MKSQNETVKIEPPIHEVMQANFDRRYELFYNKSPNSFLNLLCEKYGSDKGSIKDSGHAFPWPPHTYADFLERHFGHCREYVKNVFECGIGTTNPDIVTNMGIDGKPGASLKVWSEYFPNANIYGADIDKDVLFKDTKIDTFYCDQTDPSSIKKLWKNMEGVTFDLMIDDGLHTVQAGICLFENSFHKLKAGGTYIIEDVRMSSLIKFKNYFMGHPFEYNFVNLYRENTPLSDNSLVVIRR